MADLILNSSLTHTLLLVVPIAAALLLRWARCPGWSVVGGVAAGLLLGSTILGRVLPREFEAHFTGGVEEREAMDQLRARHRADMLAASHAQLDQHAIDELRERHDEEVGQTRAALDGEQWRFQRPFRSYTTAVTVLSLLFAGLLRIPDRDRRQGWIAPASIGAWAALVPGGLAVAVGVYWFEQSWPASLIIGAAVGIGPWVLTRIDRDAADQVEHGGAHMIQRAGRIASVVALIVLGVAASRLETWAWWCTLLALPLGWMLPPAIEWRRWIDAAAHSVFIPSMAACAALRVDAIDSFSLWPIVVIVILSGDGRMLGALIGALFPGGRTPLRTMRLVLGAMAAGPTQIAVTAIAVHTLSIESSWALALLLGAVVIEVTTPLRRTMNSHLDQLEEEIESTSAS